MCSTGNDTHPVKPVQSHALNRKSFRHVQVVYLVLHMKFKNKQNDTPSENIVLVHM